MTICIHVITFIPNVEAAGLFETLIITIVTKKGGEPGGLWKIHENLQ
jgi:hypothetical protein